VIVVVPDRYETSRLVVSALRQQTVREKLELVIVGFPKSDLVVTPSDLEGFACYQVLKVESDILAHAQAAGVRAAHAPLIVFTEDHCFPDTCWAEALIKKHNEPWAAVGPVLYNANPGTAVSWANFIMKYGEWTPPLPKSAPRHIPSHNSSYKRAVLLEFGDQLEKALQSETPMQWKMVRKGYRICLEPEAKTYHLNYSDFFGSIAMRFHGGRQFAGHRSERWGLALRLAYFFGSPLIPCIRMARCMRTTIRLKKYRLIPGMLPYLMMLLALDGLGEMTGYLFGIDPVSAKKISEMEFHRERFLVPGDRALLESINRENRVLQTAPRNEKITSGQD